MLHSVIGSPNSLLYDSSFAWHPRDASAAASRSLVDVFPVEPPTATTCSSGRSRRNERAISCERAERVADVHERASGRELRPHRRSRGRRARRARPRRTRPRRSRDRRGRPAARRSTRRRRSIARVERPRVDGRAVVADDAARGTRARSRARSARVTSTPPAPRPRPTRSSNGTVTPAAVWPVS